MDVPKYDPKSVRVADKSPSFLQNLLFDLISGMAPKEGRPRTKDEELELRDFLNTWEPDGPPAVLEQMLDPTKDYLKTRRFGNQSVDDYIRRNF